MTLRFAAIIAGALALIGEGAVLAAETAPDAPKRVGATDKICQLTGDVDWETGRPTADRTQSNFGLEAVDLGYPVEHHDRLFLLFGDTRPATHGAGADSEIVPDDSVGFTSRREAPGRDGRCLDLQMNDRPGSGAGPKKLVPPTIVGPVAIKQGWFNVPTGGVSVGGGLYVFFWTNHCTGPARLEPSPDAPLARPPATRTCSENDDRSSIGRTVLARSDDDGRTFHDVVPMPTGFVYAAAVDPEGLADLPKEQQSGILIFAVPRYRASAPYLALAPRGTFANPTTWRYFAGRNDNGEPKWITQAEWTRGVAPGSAWRAPGDAELLGADGRCLGEFSVTWNAPLRQWLMLYACRGARVMARVASAPWGPWSPPANILSMDDGIGCRVMMMAKGCDNRRDFWPGRPHIGKVVAGSLYAPFVLNRYSSAAGGAAPGRNSTIYWLVSTWNPYEVSVMRTTLHIDAP